MAAKAASADEETWAVEEAKPAAAQVQAAMQAKTAHPANGCIANVGNAPGDDFSSKTDAAKPEVKEAQPLSAPTSGTPSAAASTLAVGIAAVGTGAASLPSNPKALPKEADPKAKEAAAKEGEERRAKLLASMTGDLGLGGKKASPNASNGI